MKPLRNQSRFGWGLRTLVLLALVFPQVARGQSGDDILRTGDRLLTEERRQLDVRRRLNVVVRRIDWLLEDLESNQLSEQGESDQIAGMNKILLALGQTNVPAAASFLREARSDLDVAHKHITGADKEIELIVAELEKFIQGSALVDDLLLRQLRQIIKTEEFLRRQTATWGKKMILDPDSAQLDQGRLSRAQQSVIGVYGQFFQLLVKTRTEASEEESGKRYAAAEKLLLEARPADLLTKAIGQINRKKAIAAVGDQDTAIAALREAEKILAANEDDILDLIKELEQILKDQVELKDEVEEAEQNTFKVEQSQFEAKQLEVGKDLAELTGTPPPQATTTTPSSQPQAQPPSALPFESTQLEGALGDAQQAIAAAQTELSQGDQGPAVQAQEQAIAALERAIAEAEAAAEAEAEAEGFGE
ncbi:MAG: hypothetical protein OER86_11760, partial [Phycisphaerae bacterium]|nr:hypothetical protein [Phycisphaerae bacterium]